MVKVLIKWFNLFGFPKFVRSDNGPAFRGRFTDWLNENCILHETISSYNSSSLGGAENAVGRVKDTLKKVIEERGDVETALAEMRNFKSRATGVSPGELFFRRHIRGKLPTLPGKTNYQEIVAKKEILLQKRLNDMSTKMNPSKELEPGALVRVQNVVTGEWRLKAMGLKRRENTQSYWIKDQTKSSARPVVVQSPMKIFHIIS